MYYRSVLLLGYAVVGAAAVLVNQPAVAAVRSWREPIQPVLQLGHCGPVHSLAVSPRGDQFASASDDGTIRLWDLRSGEVRRVISGPHGVARGLAYSSDARKLYFGSGPSWISFDVLSGDRVETRQSHDSYQVVAIAASPDRRYLATIGSDPDTPLTLWNAQTRTVVKQLPHQGSTPSAVTFSRDGAELFLGKLDGGVIGFAWSTGKFHVIRPSTGIPVRSLAFVTAGRRLVIGSADGTVQVVNEAGGRLVGTLASFSPNTSRPYAGDTVLSPDGKLLVTGSGDDAVRAWGLDHRTLKWRSAVGTRVTAVTTVPGGRFIISAEDSLDQGLKGDLRLLDAQTGRLIRTYRNRGTGTYTGILSPDGRFLACDGQVEELSVWDLRRATLVQRLKVPRPFLRDAAFSNDNAVLAAVDYDGRVHVWKLAAASQQANTTSRQRLSSAYQSVDSVAASVAISPDGKMLAVGLLNHGTHAGAVQLWDWQRGHLLATLRGHTNAVISVTFSVDGKRLASGSQDNSVRIWDLLSHACIQTLSQEVVGFWPSPQLAVFSADSQSILTHGGDDEVHLWDVNSGKHERTFTTGAGEVRSLALTNEGIICAHGSNITVWDHTTGATLRKLKLPAQGVLLPLSANGNRICFSSEGNIQLWDVRDGQEVATVVNPPALRDGGLSQDWLIISPGGYYAASPKAEAQLLRWRIAGELAPAGVMHDLNRPDMLRELLREPEVLTSEQTARVAQAVELLHRPGWSDFRFWDFKQRQSVIPTLAELSRFDLDTLRSALRQVAVKFRGRIGSESRAVANAYALNRYLFNIPTTARSIPGAKGRSYSLIDPLTVGQKGDLELSLSWDSGSLNGGIWKDLPEVDLEFDRFRAKYGVRPKPGWASQPVPSVGDQSSPTRNYLPQCQ